MNKLQIIGLALLVSACGSGEQGEQGQIGAQGTPGKDGVSIVTTTTSATSSECLNGGSVILIAQDTQNNGVFNALDNNIQSIVVCNGVDGNTGAAGPQGPKGDAGQNAPITTFSSVVPIQPCGATSSAYKEVLLCLADGSVLSSFSINANGDNTRLSFLPDGTFQDTDESGCIFSVAIDTQYNTTVSWNAQNGFDAGSYTCQNQMN